MSVEVAKMVAEVAIMFANSANMVERLQLIQRDSFYECPSGAYKDNTKMEK